MFFPEEEPDHPGRYILTFTLCGRLMSLPDWLPWWAQLLLLIAGVLITLAFVMMPFSVFGVKSRLEAIEARLDELQGEIRTLALRLPEPGRPSYEAEGFGRAITRPLAAVPRPPVPPHPLPPPSLPPASWTPDSAPRRPIGVGRVEPRIDKFR